MAVTYPATTHDEARQLDIQNANQFHQILQGDIDTEVNTYEGLGKIPSVAKAMFEAAAYRLPLDWEEGVDEVDLLQPRLYEGNIYVPVFVPAPMLATPDNANWRLYRPVTGVIQMVERHLGSELSGNSLILDNQYVPGNNNIQVFVNRSLWFPGEDFTEVSATRIDFINVPGPEDEIIIYVGQMTTTQYDPSFTGSTLRSWVFQGDGGNQYSILGADSDIAEAYIVFIDGARLIPDVSYTVDSATDTITFTNSYTSQQQISVLGIGQVIVAEVEGGDVNGPSSSTTRGITVFSDTTGKSIEDSGVTIDSSGNLVGAGNLVKTISAETYTVSNDDSGCILYFTAINPVTVTFPGPTALPLTKNISVLLIQGGDGQVTAVGDTESSIETSKPSATTAGPQSAISIVRIDDTIYWLTGETQ